MAPPRGRREHYRWCDLGCRLRKDQSESSKIKTANLLRPCGRVNELGSPETSRCRQRGCWVTGPTSWWWRRTEKDGGDRRGESWRQQLQTDKLLTKGGAEDYMGSDRRRGDREAHQNPVRNFLGFSRIVTTTALCAPAAPGEERNQLTTCHRHRRCVNNTLTSSWRLSRGSWCARSRHKLSEYSLNNLL